ncbi:Golgi membrane exchange factor (Ric1p-Rgp1p) subunit [Tilletia horrida]|nr:Golgi membrane exchange factor (Ric1p-Rgp1p) subunit [Tilletia horrida]
MTLTVSVRPASSSFFAGEQFLCYITFTNTAQPQAGYADAEEKEGQQHRKQQDPFAHRYSTSEDDRLSEATPSESDAATDTASVAGNGSAVAHQQQDSGAESLADEVGNVSISTGNLPARKPSTPIGRSHPHSRKLSIKNDFHLAFPDDPLFNQAPSASPARADALSAPSSIAPSTPSRGPVISPLFPSGAASSSTTSLALSTTSGSIADKASPSRRVSLSSSELRGKLAQTPGSAHILWSFAQLAGSFQLDESIIKPAEFNALKQRLVNLSGATTAGGVFGGGDLGHEVQLDVDERVGWGAYLKNALTAPISPGLNSPNPGQDWGSPSLASTPRSAKHMPSASLAVPSGLANGMTSSPSIGPVSPSISRRRVSHKRTGSTLQDTRERTLMNRNIPTLSTPPSILFVDHVLAPGESKTYSFRLPLPLDLPPSFLGRSIQFTYTLTIGINRSTNVSPNSPSLNGIGTPKSRLFTIPVRLYNNVALPHGEPAFWDLGNPVIKGRDEGMVQYEPQGPPSALSSGDTDSLATAQSPGEDPTNGQPGTLSRRPSTASVRGEKNILELQSYARALLGLPDEDEAPGPNGWQTSSSSASSSSNTLARPNMAMRRTSSSNEAAAAEDVESHTCASATDILATNSPKVSYDISKDGSIAAVLTLVRSRYRLGDTVQGVVTINAPTALTRIVRLAVTLESHEDIEPTLSMVAPVSKAVKATRIVHAEHHESTLDKGRVPFSLSIPSGATPDFKTSAVKLKWTVKLSLLTLASVKQPSADSTFAPPSSPALPRTPDAGPPPSTPGSTAPSTPLTPGLALAPASAPDALPRLAPPPHLMPSKPDGFALYHSAWRAVRHLAGPGVAAVGHPAMLAPVSLEKRKRELEETLIQLDDGEEKKKEKSEEGEEVTPTSTAQPTASPREKEAEPELEVAVSAPTGTDAYDEGEPDFVPPAFANETRLEIVECAVPVRILPSTTNFAVGDFVFEA